MEPLNDENNGNLTIQYPSSSISSPSFHNNDNIQLNHMTEWSCTTCTFPNKDSHSECEICRASKSIDADFAFARRLQLNHTSETKTKINKRSNNNLFGDSEEEKAEDNNHVRPSNQLRTYASRPTSCNGDCGAPLSKLINKIIHPEVVSCIRHLLIFYECCST